MLAEEQEAKIGGQGVTMRLVKQLFVRYAIVAVLICFIIALGMMNSTFLTATNMEIILLQVSTNALLAIGATYTILTAGIDLSVGSIVGMSGVVAALAAQHPGPEFVVIAVAAGVAAGLAIGLLNGLLVAIGRVPPFIVTLGTMTIGLSVAYVLSQGEPISSLSNGFLAIGQSTLLTVPIPILVMVAAFAAFYIVLVRTPFGRYVYAVGGNEEAARNAGVNTKRVKVLVYCISGFLAGVAGVILASRVTAGIPTTGSGYELNAIAATVIGGTSLMGGRGTLWGTAVGFLIIGIMLNGLDILNVSPFYQGSIEGLIIIGAVYIDAQIHKA